MNQPAGSTPPSEPEGEDAPGPGLVNLDFAGTGALIVAALVGVLAPDGFGVVTAVVSGALFVVGVIGFLWGYATGVVRSREERVGFGGLFFLSGSAPRVIRFRLRLAFAVQVVVAVLAASLRPYTSVAFAVLAPMLGMGIMAAWAARHGTFPAREPRR